MKKHKIRDGLLAVALASLALAACSQKQKADEQSPPAKQDAPAKPAAGPEYNGKTY